MNAYLVQYILGGNDVFQEVNKLSDELQSLDNLKFELETAKRCITDLELSRAQQLTIERCLRETQKRYQSVIDNVKEVIFQTDAAGQWIFLNQAWTEVTGFSIEESLGTDFSDNIHPEDRERNRELFISMIEQRQDYCRHEIRYFRKDGSYCWIEVLARLTLDDNGDIIGTSGTLSDITERKTMEFELKDHRDRLEELVLERTYELYQTNEHLKQEIAERKRSEEKLMFLAMHDSLTGIPNRYCLEQELEKLTAHADSSNPSALLFIDLDNFKIVNDTYGHNAGDQLLVSLTNLFQRKLKESDVLFRLGGDEFAVLLKNTNAETALKRAEAFRSSLDEGELCAETFEVCFNLTISIGLVIIDGLLDVQGILSSADTALYAAKEEGKNRILTIQSDKDKAKLSEKNILVTQIKNALRDDRFVLHFQPVYKLGEGIIHYEALIRMQDEDGSLLYPNSFIPIAERFGLMSQIDRWVVTTALTVLKEQPEYRIFVNLSGLSLGDQALIQFIETKITESGIEPDRIGFEITETTAVKDLTQVEKWICLLKNLGCFFALDDFGVGFSSFSYLNALPVDYLKIDGSFIRDLDTNPKQRAVVQAMNAVGHALGKETIAEFVENEAILRILQEIGVDCGQGYYFGKPKPLF